MTNDPAPNNTANGSNEASSNAAKPSKDYAPDWTISACATSHMWNSTTTSGDLCYISSEECCGTGARRKCSVCKVICHDGCLKNLSLECRPSFVERTIRTVRDENSTSSSLLHHWVLRKRLDAQCKGCKKTIKYSFSSKEPVAMQCSWCKVAYHLADCFKPSEKMLNTERCDLGVHRTLFVPPDCIVKVSDRKEFESSVRRASSSNTAKMAQSSNKPQNGDIAPASNENNAIPVAQPSKAPLANKTPFVILSNSNEECKPLIVFLNPKSGGNQGKILFKKFQYLLNPRQVFDLTQGGPEFGLQMFRNVNNVHILACGGDGTAGWVMASIDKLGMTNPPPIAVLPLGTGNDLARVLNWGPGYCCGCYVFRNCQFKLNKGYADEPLSKILLAISNGIRTNLDRWNLLASPNPEVTLKDEEMNEGHPELPLDVFNNYFSLGVDAAVALKFHESREANPDRFNSRIYNKYFYLKAGGEKMVKNDLRDLKDQITLVCDDKDYTKKLDSIKPAVILFLNIPSYSAGTNPWGRSSGDMPQSFNDKRLEVISLTSMDLASIHLQMAGTRICQCSQAIISTKKTMPVQVDGEPRRVLPSVIKITHRNQACVIMKRKRRGSSAQASESRTLSFNCLSSGCNKGFESN